MTTFTHEKDGKTFFSIYPQPQLPALPVREEWKPADIVEAVRGIYGEDKTGYDRRLKAYRAEDRAQLAFGMHGSYEIARLDGSQKAAQAYVDKVLRSAFVRKNWPRAPRKVQVNITSRGGAMAYGLHTINLGTGSGYNGNKWVVLHEVAHILCHLDRTRGHGREFAHVYLKLVRRFLGAEAATALREAYKIEGLKFTAPRKAA